MMNNVLEMRNITKRFPGVLANDHVNFKLQQGEIHVLLGENGAGKTTLMNILYGLTRLDEGEILINGKTVQIHSPTDALSYGVGMVHQHFMLVPNMTVAENVIIGREPRHGPFLALKEVAEQIRQLSRDFGLDLDPDRYIWQLSAGEQQRVEIFKALYRGADILILDEPTSVLSPPEIEALFRTLKSFVNAGKSIILITHKLHEILSISDRITVMRRGQVQGTVCTSEIDKKSLANMLVGHDVEFPVVCQIATPGPTVASLQSLRVEGDYGKAAVSDFQLELRAGEIVGIAGVDGNGQSELVEAIVGLRKITSGHLLIDDRDLTDSPAWKRIDAGVKYVPADRKRRGVAPSLSIAENAGIKNYRTAPYSRHGFLRTDAIRQFARGLVQTYDIRCKSIDTLAGTLSGGNMQKLLLAREADENSRLLVVEHPTQGLDIGAIEFVRRTLLDKRDKGTAILLISADLDEVLELSDRIIVMYEGSAVYACRHGEIDREAIGLAMAGLM